MNSRTTEEELERTREAFKEFISSAIHDLREPLRGIGVNSELLSGICGNTGDARAEQCLRHILQGVERMDLLLRAIAQYCYGDGREFRPVDTKMDAALGEARRQLHNDLERNEATVTNDPLPVVVGDFFGLSTVFRNLLENACKFRAAAAPCIHVGSARRESEWFFFVRDNGLGFDQVYAANLFQPFKRLHGKQFPGNGLGLALARRILEQHDGRIWVDSKPGEGSTFWFSLPAAS